MVQKNPELQSKLNVSLEYGEEVCLQDLVGRHPSFEAGFGPLQLSGLVSVTSVQSGRGPRW